MLRGTQQHGFTRVLLACACACACASGRHVLCTRVLTDTGDGRTSVVLHDSVSLRCSTAATTHLLPDHTQMLNGSPYLDNTHLESVACHLPPRVDAFLRVVARFHARKSTPTSQAGSLGPSLVTIAGWEAVDCSQRKVRSGPRGRSAEEKGA